MPNDEALPSGVYDLQRYGLSLIEPEYALDLGEETIEQAEIAAK